MGERFIFSNCGLYLAHLKFSGLIRIWETETNVLKQEFTTSSHLSSPCTSVQWLTVLSSVSSSKKRRSDSKGRQASLLVLGAGSGHVIYYSVAEGEIISSLKVHNNGVSALAADVGTDLYSGSDDLIIRWNISNRKPKSKWKNNTNINSMAVSKDNKLLLTAQRSIIVCWNIEDQRKISTFKGHNSNVILMDILESTSGENYLFSAAKDDRVINAWNLNDSRSRPVTMFRLTDTPQNMSCQLNGNGTMTLAVVTTGGSLHAYSHQLNGATNTPLKPDKSVLVMSDMPQATGEKTKLIPIISAKVSFDRLKICYGFATFIVFEYVDLKSTESDIFLVRQDPRITSRKDSEHRVGKVKSVEVDENAEYLNPAVINRSLKREWDAEEEQITMESLLDKMSLSSKSQPSGDSMALMLIQGLNSQDKKILRNVLKVDNKEKIMNTVQRLPVQAVMPLLKFLTTLVQSRSWMSEKAAEWLQALVRIHVSQLIADESFGSVVAPLLGLVETRLGCIGPLCKLRGRLDLLLEQTSSASGTKTKPLEVEPLLVYQDNDSPNSNCLFGGSEEEEDEDDDDDDKFDWSDKDTMEVDEENDSSDDSDDSSNEQPGVNGFKEKRDLDEESSSSS